MKYGIWKCAQPEAQDVNALVSGGFPPLAAMVLAGRGLKDAKKAQDFLCCSGALPDPFAMTDMDKAADRVRKALEAHEKIAVFGDYDVDGITDKYAGTKVTLEDVEYIIVKQSDILAIVE